MSMTSSERWTLGLSVVSTLIATLGTLFAGYQTLLTRDAFFASRTTNLQAKEIEYCEQFLVSLSGFNRAYEENRIRWLKQATFSALEVANDNDATDSLVNNSEKPEWMASEFSRKINDSELVRAAMEVRASADYLAIYASSKSVDMLDSVAANVFVVALMITAADAFALVEFPQGTPDEINAKVAEPSRLLAEKCKSVTLGQSEGLY